MARLQDHMPAIVRLSVDASSRTDARVVDYRFKIVENVENVDAYKSSAITSGWGLDMEST